MPARKRKVQRSPGRRSVLTPVIQEAIVATIRQGNYIVVACARVNLAPGTFYDWMARGRGDLMDADPPMPPWAVDDPEVYPEGHEHAGEPYPGRFAEFHDAVIRAQADSEAHAVGVIRQAMVVEGDWRAAEAWLKRRFPERWREESFQEVEQTVTHHAPELPDEETVAGILAAWKEAGIEAGEVVEGKLLEPPSQNGKANGKPPRDSTP